MNKTVNINLGGMFFHIDEDAYQKLTRYFDAIKRSLSTSTGQDEIIKDIEMRIAELVSEKHTNEKQVINVKEVDEIITVMGQPEDYRIEDDAPGTPTGTFEYSKRNKKLYRDTERGMLGGVAAGLGHYFGIDVVWIRIFLFVFVWLGGSGIIAYIVLWIVMPEAVTTSEKLEMTGEPVTISNIERKVREEFENVSEKIKNANYDKMGNHVKTGASRVAGNLGDVFLSIFKVFAKVLGAIMVVFSSLSLLGVCIASIVMMFSSSLPENTIMNHFNTPIGLETPLWLQGLLFLLAAGIPLFFLLILGLKLLVTHLRSIGNIAKYTLLAFWVITMGILISLGISEATQLAYDGKTVQNKIISVNAGDTLYVKFKTNAFYTKHLDNHDDFKLTQDENNKEVIYSNNVSIEIMQTDEAQPYLQIERMAKGKTANEAKKRSGKIGYKYEIKGNQLILDNYLITESINKFRGQNVALFLYLPKGIYLKPDSSLQDYDQSYDMFFNMHYSGNYLYRVDENKVVCLDCPAEENELDDLEIAGDGTDSTTTLTVKNGEVSITEHSESNGEKKKVSSLEVGKNGVIIKTE